MKVIKEITNAKNKAREVPVTLYLTPLHRLSLPMSSATIVEMQSRTELAIMAYMDRASRLREQMDTIKGSRLAKMSPKYSDFNLALEGVIQEFDKKEAQMRDFIQANKEDEDALMAKLEQVDESTAPLWVSLLLQEVDAMDEFIETTTGEEKGIEIVFTDVRSKQSESTKDILLCKLSLTSMMNINPKCAEKKPKQNWVSNASFFREALKMVNMMVQAKKENPERFKFLIWVDYMQEENKKLIEIIGRVSKVLSPWEDELPPVIEHIDVEQGKIDIPQSSLHLSVVYEFSATTVWGKDEELIPKPFEKEQKEAIDITDPELELWPGRSYNVRARYKATTSGLLGPWSAYHNFKTDVKVKGELSSFMNY